MEQLGEYELMHLGKKSNVSILEKRFEQLKEYKNTHDGKFPARSLAESRNGLLTWCENLRKKYKDFLLIKTCI